MNRNDGVLHLPQGAGKTTPTFPYWPKIIEFLGYSPFDPAWSRGERLTWIRRYLGLSQEAMARRLRVDPGTLARWEQGEREPKGEHLRRISSLHRNAR